MQSIKWRHPCPPKSQTGKVEVFSKAMGTYSCGLKSSKIKEKSSNGDYLEIKQTDQKDRNSRFIFSL